MKKISAIATIIAVSAMLGAGTIAAKPDVKLSTVNVSATTDTIPGAVKKPRPGQVNQLPPQVTPNPIPNQNTTPTPTPTPMPGVTPNPVTPGVTPTPMPMPGVTPTPVTPGVTPSPAPIPVTPNPVSPGATPVGAPRT
jgi:hypothetical protein